MSSLAPELFVCLEEFGGGDGSKATVAIWLRKAKVGNLVVVVLQVDQMGGLTKGEGVAEHALDLDEPAQRTVGDCRC